MKIHYISSYVESDYINTYRVTPSVAAKVGYIKRALKQASYSISLFNIVCTTRNFPIKSRYLKVDDLETQFYPFSIGGLNSILRIISYSMIYFQLFIYLAKVGNEDSVLLYHSPNDTKVVKFFNRFLKKKIYLELEELYSALGKDNDKIVQEKKVVGHGFAGYIVVNTMITQRCNIDRPSAICEGQYIMINDIPKKIVSADGKIHVVYAGVFLDDQDVFLAIKTASFLNNSYKIHIAGYGDEHTVLKVIRMIKEHNSRNAGCVIEFHGCLHGTAYEDLLDMCSVGLCTRVLEDSLSDYTFPSKVYAYLSRNLMVICTPISCVKSSPIANSIIFTQSSTPEEVAHAIKTIDNRNIIDNKALLHFQNVRFMNEVTVLFDLV